MSEGQVFFSNTPNITYRIHGTAFAFKNGRYPAHGEEYDAEKIAMLKQHGEYGKTFISEEDRKARAVAAAENRNSPKAEAAMVEMAMAALQGIPGVIPSDLTTYRPQEAKPQDSVTSSKEVTRSPEPESEQSEPAPSLTKISRMKKKQLLELGARLGVEDLNETDTVSILRKRVKSFVRLNT